MKKTLFLIAVICLVTSVSRAQVEKGTISLGGAIGYASFDDPQMTSMLDLSGNSLYFPENNFGVGLTPRFSYSHSTIGVYTAINIAPSVKYYFGKEIFKPFLTGGIGYTNTSIPYHDDNGFGSFTFSSVSGFVGGGAEYFLSKYLGVGATLQINLSKSFDSQPYYSEVLFLVGFNMYIP